MTAAMRGGTWDRIWEQSSLELKMQEEEQPHSPSEAPRNTSYRSSCSAVTRFACIISNTSLWGSSLAELDWKGRERSKRKMIHLWASFAHSLYLSFNSPEHKNKLLSMKWHDTKSLSHLLWSDRLLLITDVSSVHSTVCLHTLFWWYK